MKEKMDRLDIANEVAREIELEVEELEPMVAPGINLNHNESFICDQAS